MKIKEIISLLSDSGVTDFVFEYSGYGDEGSIDRMYVLFSSNPNEEINAYPSTELVNLVRNKDSFGIPNDIYCDLVDFMYSVLYSAFPGWEINDGSAGRILYKVTSGYFDIQNTWNVIHTEDESAQVTITDNEDNPFELL